MIQEDEITDLGDIPLGEPEFVDDDDDDDGENVISLKRIKAETGFGENGEIFKSVSPTGMVIFIYLVISRIRKYLIQIVLTVKICLTNFVENCDWCN